MDIILQTGGLWLRDDFLGQERKTLPKKNPIGGIKVSLQVRRHRPHRKPLVDQLLHFLRLILIYVVIFHKGRAISSSSGVSSSDFRLIIVHALSL